DSHHGGSFHQEASLILLCLFEFVADLHEQLAEIILADAVANSPEDVTPGVRFHEFFLTRRQELLFQGRDGELLSQQSQHYLQLDIIPVCSNSRLKSSCCSLCCCWRLTEQDRLTSRAIIALPNDSREELCPLIRLLDRVKQRAVFRLHFTSPEVREPAVFAKESSDHLPLLHQTCKRARAKHSLYQTHLPSKKATTTNRSSRRDSVHL